MRPFVEAFVLGNGAILTNVCVLPLYPGLVAFLAADAAHDRRGVTIGWLGLLVLAGVLTTMTAVGFVLFLLRWSFGTVLPILLPLVYGVVVLLGLLLLVGRNPFAGLRTLGGPVFRNPYAAAVTYGLLLGPITLPCAGPLLVSAFIVGAGSIATLADSLLYCFAFGLGFGWPLIVLPLLAAPIQGGVTRWLAAHYGALTRVSGLVLIGIALYGAWSELLPLAR